MMIERRGFLGAIGALAAVGVAPAVASRHYGAVDWDRHRLLCAQGIHLRIYVNGEDVSGRCRFFDDTPGHERAELFLHRNGRPYLARDHGEYGEGRLGRVAMETVHNFEVRPGPPFR